MIQCCRNGKIHTGSYLTTSDIFSSISLNMLARVAENFDEAEQKAHALMSMYRSRSILPPTTLPIQALGTPAEQTARRYADNNLGSEKTIERGESLQPIEEMQERHDTIIEEMQKQNQALQAKIESLQAENETLRTTFEQQIEEMQIQHDEIVRELQTQVSNFKPEIDALLANREDYMQMLNSCKEKFNVCEHTLEKLRKNYEQNQGHQQAIRDRSTSPTTGTASPTTRMGGMGGLFSNWGKPRVYSA